MKSIRFKYRCLRVLLRLDPFSAAVIALATEALQGDIFTNDGLLRVAHLWIQLPTDECAE